MWLLRFRVRKEGRRVEHGTIIGTLLDFQTKEDAWKEVDRIGVRAFLNKDNGSGTTLLKVVTEYMNKVHGLDYDISAKDWKPIKDSRRAKTTTDGVKWPRPRSRSEAEYSVSGVERRGLVRGAFAFGPEILLPAATSF